MTAATLCPLCLTELPAGYPYDHVAIDYALQGRQQLTGAERDEAIREGHRRNIPHTRIARHLRVNGSHILAVLGLEPAPRANPVDPDFDTAVKRLWADRHTDLRIALTLGASRKQIYRSRRRQNLPSHYGPAGRRLTEGARA